MSRIAARAMVAVASVAVLTGCGSPGPSAPKDARPSSSSPREDACSEVRAGIAAYNAKDFGEVQPHFVRARVFAKTYAQKNPRPEADDLLVAIEFFAKVAPTAYAKTADSLRLFKKYKVITLGACENDGGEATPTPGQPA